MTIGSLYIANIYILAVNLALPYTKHVLDMYRRNISAFIDSRPKVSGQSLMRELFDAAQVAFN